MKRLLFGHLFVLLTLAPGAYASELRLSLHDSVDNLTYENCVENTEGIVSILDNIDAQDLKMELASDSHSAVLNDLWSIKLKTHERLQSFHRVGFLSPECAEGIRAVFRGIRTFEDYIELNRFKTHGSTLKFPDNAFEPGNVHVRRHPDHLNFNLNKDLRTGDIILSRGNAYTSAAIASLGEYDTQFSHLSVVYKDDNGKLWTVEAHIEVGSFVRPLEEHIEDKNYRTMVYRFEDDAIARKAGEYIFNKVKKASDTTGNILYDFGFDLDDPKQLFCSEIASHAYRYSSDDKIKIPMFRSQVLSRKAELVKQLGITVESSFIPADIEVDPRFNIISEWRDANRTNDNLQKDAIVHAMFKWSDEQGYVLQQGKSKESFLYRNIAWPLRRVPYLKKYFVDKMPINMSRKLIGYFGVLESMGKFLQAELADDDKAAEVERGFPLSRKEKFQVLEKVRLNDLDLKKKRLHKMFKPEKNLTKLPF